jgi:transcriptional regulator with XRE-family HTH domain
VRISKEASEVLVQRRQAMGMTQEDLAQRSGLSVRMISDLERGRTRRPHPRSLQLLTSALELDRSELLPVAVDGGGADPGGLAFPNAPALRRAATAAGGDSPLVIPQQLPMAPRHFVGREDELRALDALLEERHAAPGLALVHGQPGVGKTALVVRWAHQLNERFPHGRLYVDLQHQGGVPLTPGEAIRDFLNALGVTPAQVPDGLHAQSALLRSVLAEKRVLMVLDNAESSEQVVPLLPGTAGCVAVVTSRRKLTDLVARHGAQPLGLDVLSFREAWASLEQLLGHGRVAAEAQATAQLIEHCQYCPLALSEMAAHAAVHPELRLATLAEQLIRPGQRRVVVSSVSA